MFNVDVSIEHISIRGKEILDKLDEPFNGPDYTSVDVLKNFIIKG